MSTRVSKPEDPLDLGGEPMGVSDWYELTQHQVNQVADEPRDHQGSHVNPEQANDGPIAHEYLTLSLASQFLADTLDIDELSARLNYGLSKVRFTAPVPIGSQVPGGGPPHLDDPPRGGCGSRVLGDDRTRWFAEAAADRRPARAVHVAGPGDASGRSVPETTRTADDCTGNQWPQPRTQIDSVPGHRSGGQYRCNPRIRPAGRSSDPNGRGISIGHSLGATGARGR
jgi:hypothetical protein